jgi:YidC/Oxa1 family membrane protein insertase
VRNPVSVQHAIYYDLPNTKLKSLPAGDAKNGPVSASGAFSFVGIEDSYFTAVFLPGDKVPSVEEITYADPVPDADGKDEKRVGVGVGGEGLNAFSLFVGPKDTDLLRQVNPRLEQVVDWGWFGLIAKPLFIVLNWTTDHVAHNYGWSIVLVTLVINILLFPLKISSMKSSKKMQALQPQIKAINDKYKGLSMKDPKKADQNQEVMDLYKKNGVNPVGGCLPMLLQMPFLYAFYKVLGVSTEMRGAHWLWVTDLSQPETLAIHLLPILLVVTQFAMQRMTPSPGVDPSQQKMMMFMPLMFGYMFYFASAGLVIYWLTGNVVGIVQQWLLNKSMPAVAVTPAKPPSGKKGRN